MVSPDAPQMTSTLIAVRARPECTSHAVVSQTIPSLDSRKFTVPEDGWSSTTLM